MAAKPLGRRGLAPALTLNYIVLVALTLFALLPLGILVFNSLKSNTEIGANPLGPPRAIQWDNFPQAWEQGGFATTTRNSAVLVLGTIIGVLVFGGMAAYSLARLQLPGGDAIMLLLLVISTIPVQLFLVPLFFLWKQIGLINTHAGLIVLYTAINAPFAIFLLRSYMIRLPTDFEDAARVDGANEIQVFGRIVLPLSWPGFLTVGLVVGLNVWNEFFLATVFISDPDLFPMATSYYKFASRFSRNWSLTSSAAILMIAPVLVLFLLLQRRFIDGLTQGGVKG